MKKMSKTTKVLAAILAVVIVAGGVLFAANPGLFMGKMSPALPATQFPSFKGDFMVKKLDSSTSSSKIATGSSAPVAIYEIFANKSFTINSLTFKIDGLANPSASLSYISVKVDGGANESNGSYKAQIGPGKLVTVNFSRNMKMYQSLKFTLNAYAKKDALAGGKFSVTLSGIDADLTLRTKAVGGLDANVLKSSDFSIVNKFDITIVPFDSKWDSALEDVQIFKIAISNNDPTWCYSGSVVDSMAFHLTTYGEDGANFSGLTVATANLLFSPIKPIMFEDGLYEKDWGNGGQDLMLQTPISFLDFTNVGCKDPIHLIVSGYFTWLEYGSQFNVELKSITMYDKYPSVSHVVPVNFSKDLQFLGGI